MNLALTTPPEITKIITTNLIGTIFANQIFSTTIKSNKGGESLTFHNCCIYRIKGESIYCASKQGSKLSQNFANELSAFNITVNCVAPGPIRTNLLKGVSDKQIKDIIARQIIKK